MSYQRRLAALAQALTRQTSAVTDPRAQWEAERAAWYARFWTAVQETLNHGMPREYGQQVYAELQAGTPLAEQSPLSGRVTQLGQYAGWAPQAPYPYQGPYVVPRAHCELLVTEPPGVVTFHWLACVRCHLEAPYRNGNARGGERAASGVAPWGRYLDTCAHCGGIEIALPAHLRSS